MTRSRSGQTSYQTVQEFDHLYVSIRILSARSGPGHLGHPRSKSFSVDLARHLSHMRCSKCAKTRTTATFPSSKALCLQPRGCRFPKCCCCSCSGYVKLGNVTMARDLHNSGHVKLGNVAVARVWRTFRIVTNGLVSKKFQTGVCFARVFVRFARQASSFRKGIGQTNLASLGPPLSQERSKRVACTMRRIYINSRTLGRIALDSQRIYVSFEIV